MKGLRRKGEGENGGAKIDAQKIKKLFSGSSDNGQVVAELPPSMQSQASDAAKAYLENLALIKDLSEKQIKMAKSKGMFRAYNFFTKELLLENASILTEAVMYLDKKVRMRDDNICVYLKREINLITKRNAIRVVEPRDSEKDDLIGIADLVLGALNYDLKKGENPMKLAVVKVVKQYVGKKIRLREWVFK